MLSRAEVERVAQTLTHGNAGHAETLYLQDIVLSTVSRETADELVFKGGTALLKFYQLDRFSEALDFTARRSVDVSELVRQAERDLENYGARVEQRRVDETADSFTARFGIQGPLYTGDRRSLCFIRIEVNTASTAQNVEIHRYTSPFSDLPSFELAVLDETEILAEKIRALMTRRQPRDLYDTYHLLEKSVPLDLGLVQEKLDYYDLEYDRARLLERVGDLEASWESLEALIYSQPPPFSETIETLEQGLIRGGTTE